MSVGANPKHAESWVCTPRNRKPVADEDINTAFGSLDLLTSLLSSFDSDHSVPFKLPLILTASMYEFNSAKNAELCSGPNIYKKFAYRDDELCLQS